MAESTAALISMLSEGTR